MANDAIPFFEPGADPTGKASAAVTGKRFLKITGNRNSDGSFPVAHADAGGKIFGVASWDTAQNGFVTVQRAPGRCVPVTADGAINADDEVEVGANGKAKALTNGIAVGRCLTGVADGADAMVALYDGQTAEPALAAAAAIGDLGALTSAQIAGGESPTEAEFNALQADVAAIRAKVNAILAALRPRIIAP